MEPEMEYAMIGGIDLFGETLFSTAVRYKIGKVWLTLCFVDEDGHVGWLDKATFEKNFGQSDAQQEIQKRFRSDS